MNVAFTHRPRVRLLATALVILSAQGCSLNQTAPEPEIVERKDGYQVIPFKVDQSRGADSRVRYARLARYGPWDDRNYELTRRDVRLLKDDQDDALIPAFYRARLQRAFLEQGQKLSHYPRSSYARFIVYLGGFEIDGRSYHDAERTVRGFQVVDKTPVPPAVYQVQRPRAPFTREAQVTHSRGSDQPWGGSAVAIKPGDPDHVIAATIGPWLGLQMYTSANGGERWRAAARLPPGAACCSPTVAWSADGAVAYVASVGESEIRLYHSFDDGKNWKDLAKERPPTERRTLGIFADEVALHVDSTIQSSHFDSLHLAWHEGGRMKYARSTDRGVTWSDPLSFDDAPTGSGPDLTTDAAGAVYYAYSSSEIDEAGNGSVQLLTSNNGGVSFSKPTMLATTNASTPFPIPAADTYMVGVQVSVTADPNTGAVYVAWTDSKEAVSQIPEDNTAHIRIARRSRNDGPWSVTDTNDIDRTEVDRFHPAVGVDLGGVVHLVFHSTRGVPLDRTQVDLMHKSSRNRGETWIRESRQTSSPSPKIVDTMQWGDRIGLDVQGESLVATFLDNRLETEPTGGDSRDIYSFRRTFIYRHIFYDGFEDGNGLNWSNTSH